VATVLVSIVVVALLGQVFPVALAVIAGFTATVFGLRGGPGSPRAGRLPIWGTLVIQALFFIGLALLIGAAGWNTNENLDRAGSGALVGAAFVVAAAGVTLVLVLRRRRRRPADGATRANGATRADGATPANDGTRA